MPDDADGSDGPNDANGDGRTGDDGSDRVDDAEVVETAAEAAEDVVFSRFDASAVDDLDVTVSFEDRVLEVDVYVQAEDGAADPERVADDAALAARGAVDDLLE